MTAAVKKRQNELQAVRDMVESIWVAIVLAFVLRAFMIEAFVIPTGSMAPRLLGKHADFQCAACGYEYAYGLPDDGISEPRHLETPCPLCGTHTRRRISPNGGDRVLVLKYLYHFREPRPWDVVVFRNPQNNRENYIKRLIALPGESVEIIHGDIFVKPSANAHWKIRRKTPHAQKAMWHVLFDNDYRPPNERIEKGTAPSWQPRVDASWAIENDGRNFRFQGAKGPAELKFNAQREHFFPRYGYNGATTHNSPTAATTGPGSVDIDPNLDVCTDLKLSLVYIPQANDSRITLKLTSLSNRFKGQVCRDGTVGLWHRRDDDPDDAWRQWGQATLKPLRLGRGHRIALSHVDFRLRLWVNGKVVLESTDPQYDADHDEARKPFLLRARGEIQQHQDGENREIRFQEPSVSLLAGGAPCELRHLTLYRDVYYTSTALAGRDPRESPRVREYGLGIVNNAGTKRNDGRSDAERWPGINRLQRRQSDRVPGWGVAPYPITLAKHPDDPDLDEFFVLGDNSPKSLDGRAWTSAAQSLRLKDRQGVPQYQLGTVPRYNLIGKAFFVYWPAGFRVPIAILEGLSIIPNVGRMRMIR